MKSRSAGLLAMMIGMMGAGAVTNESLDRGVTYHRRPDAPPRLMGPIYRSPGKSYGPGNNQRKRRKYARQTPSASKWK